MSVSGRGGNSLRVINELLLLESADQLLAVCKGS